MILGVLRNADSSRAGLIASRRVGGAVVRNLIRRRLREILRLTRPGWKSGIWMVVIARPAAAKASFDDLRDEWLRLAGRSGILQEPAPQPAQPIGGKA